MFSSNGQGTGWDEKTWRQIQKNYIEKFEEGELINLDASHYLHNMDYERIAEETKLFIEELG